MELRVENLGRIREATVEIRPLTVLVGPNHTNKTWLATTAFSALADLSSPSVVDSGFLASHPLVATSQLRRLDADLPGGRTTLRLAPRDLARSEERIAWAVAMDGVSELLGADTGPGAATFAVKRDELYVPDDAALDVNTSEGSFALRWGLSSSAGGHLRREDFVDFLGHSIGSGLAWSLPRRAIALPVDRMASGAIEGAPGIVRRFRDQLDGWRSSVPRFGSDSARAIAPVTERVLGGRIHLSETGAENFVHGESGVSLPLTASASMVRSLAPLQLYLTRAAKPGDFVLIDEPEMNAHPRAQLAIAELLACMVRWGMKVMVITHSPYIVDHLSNLMAASSIPKDRIAGIEGVLQLGTRDAVLAPGDVAAYSFEEAADGSVSVVDCLDHDAGVILNDTFGRETERLQDIFAELQRRSAG